MYAADDDAQKLVCKVSRGEGSVYSGPIEIPYRTSWCRWKQG